MPPSAKYRQGALLLPQTPHRNRRPITQPRPHDIDVRIYRLPTLEVPLLQLIIDLPDGRALKRNCPILPSAPPRTERAHSTG